MRLQVFARGIRTVSSKTFSTLSSMSSSSSLSSSTKKRERAPPDAAKAEVDKGERKDARRAVEVPRRADGTLVFDDQPTFRPNLTPRQVIEQGAFGGSYWRPIKSGVTGQSYKDAHHEFPFFDGIEERLMSRTVADVKINRFGVKSGTTLEDWEAKSWIKAQDPYGWFQWYCRFYSGRRSPDDERQVLRWNNFTGPKGRFKLNLINKIKNANTTYDDAAISPVIRQGLHHWGYDLTPADLK